MIDHAPAFHARQRAEEENRIIADLERHSAPLQWSLIVALCIFLASQVWEGWEYYADMAADNEAFVQCMNGKVIGIGDAVMKCQVHQIVGASLLANSFAAEAAPTTEVQP